MKKLLLSMLIMAGVSAGAYAQSSNAEDYAQPRPDSTVKANVTTETTVTTNRVSGDNVTTIAQETTSAAPNLAQTNIESPVKALPDPVISDDSLDLEDTMKRMGRNFKALKKAENLSEMAEPAAELSKWASQAQALGVTDVDDVPATAEQQDRFVKGMLSLRKEIADLEVAIQNNDASSVAMIMNELNDTRKKGHEYFKVD